MKLFILYRITFIVSLIILLLGSMAKISHWDLYNTSPSSILFFGFVVAFIYIVIAFIMMFQSKGMPTWEKLIWVVLLSTGFLFQIPLILFIVGLIFFIIGQKRLQQQT